METTTTNSSDSKDRRSNSCLDRSSPINKNENRTSSFTEQNFTPMEIRLLLKKTFDSSSTESIQRYSTPKHELYKLQKQSYQIAKKRITSELDQLLKNSSVIIVSDWLKVRGTFRDWTKLWAVLKPGLILFYRNPTSMNGVWVGTIVLSSCQVIQRPSKKLGFCFKIWHPLEKSIWMQKGPNNEQFGALTFPLPMNYLICRTSDETTGRCWMDALELTMKCSKLLQKTYFISSTSLASNSNDENTSFSDNELESSRIRIKKEDDRISDLSKLSRSDTSQSENSNETGDIIETPYIIAPSEEMGELGNATQTEEVAEENKSLIMHLLKQIRPGMDLSKVILPTFILEPRSLLEKLSDYYHHCDILQEAVNSSDPLIRMKAIVKFYLSGFYKKPKGLKKPYNPVLGEVYRCYFHHTKTDSKTFYLAEQISHHPPITNFYVSNRKEGFSVQGSILTKSKFYGNSLSAILDGTARITLLNKGEDYIITMPYANCKGLLIGRLTMELGGKVTIACEQTGYSADIEFKLKPFIGGQELTNLIEGKIRLEKDVLCTFSGHWDDEITLVDKATNMKSIFWKVTQSVINSRLKRYVVPIEEQQDNESEKLWQYVTSAIRQNDQILATEEKTIIENEQRKQLKERQITNTEWHPHLFHINSKTKEWMYNHLDVRPWDSHNDISTYENNFIIHTRTCHQTNHDIPKESSQFNNKISFDDPDVISILKRIERNLIRINERIECHEKQINYLQNHQIIMKQDKRTLFIQFILIMSVVIILKYIFR